MLIPLSPGSTEQYICILCIGMVDNLELFSELKHSRVREIIFDDISSNGLSGHFMIQFSHLAGLNLVLTWDYRNNIINLILSAFMIIFPQNSFWLLDVMIALVKQPWDVCLVIILTLSQHRNILLLSSSSSQRFSWLWKIWAGWHGDPPVIFSQICHLIWSELCVGSQIPGSDWSSLLSYLL